MLTIDDGDVGVERLWCEGLAGKLSVSSAAKFLESTAMMRAGISFYAWGLDDTGISAVYDVLGRRRGVD